MPPTPTTVSRVAGWQGARVVSDCWTLKIVGVPGQLRYGGPGGYLSRAVAEFEQNARRAIPIRNGATRFIDDPSFRRMPLSNGLKRMPGLERGRRGLTPPWAVRPEQRLRKATWG